MLRSLLPICSWLLLANFCVANDGIEFFEKKIRPVLVEHCYQCHSEKSQTIEGGLRLDLKAGWKVGGESGPTILPGNPDKSPLMLAIRHDASVSAMPPERNKLPESVIAEFEAWISMGAPDPRDRPLQGVDPTKNWEAEFQQRLDWWSLKPVAQVTIPEVQNLTWPRGEIDRFILSKLEQSQLRPVPEADRQTLARRLSFALTGLPPTPELAHAFARDDSPLAYERMVDKLLESPQFGERWARHWMDVVHYSDTHGYEWDVPAKNAWRYRDYLIRAFNSDVPYQRLVIEQIAGDLLESRIDAETGVNESLIGPMMLRLGERRHGDNSAAEGVSQEGIANAIDTLGKAFLGTTLACAQCHDHKLDAVEQKDFYSLAGMLMSTRYSSRTIDTVDPNLATIDQLRMVKLELKSELSRLWLAATDGSSSAVVEKLKAITAEPPPTGFPASIADIWKRSLTSALTSDEFSAERQRRMTANQTNLKLLADFRTETGSNGWQWDGSGLKHGLVADGEPVVNSEGDAALQHVLPAGRYSHVWSQRLAGCLQSPDLDTREASHFSIELVSGKSASASFVVDRALNPERLQFPNVGLPTWTSYVAGNFDTLEGSIDRAPRRVYFELATKSLNNYFPPRVGYGGLSEAEVSDERSWFGASRIFQHPAGQPPQDELARFQPLFADLSSETDWSRRLTQLLRGTVHRWSKNECDAEDVRLLNEALQLKLLPNELSASQELASLVTRYRQLEQQLQPDKTVGSVAEWNEGADSAIGIRGSYTDFGDKVERGKVRFLNASMRAEGAAETSSRRLEWAQNIASPDNPLFARVYVNRLWHYLFGTGLVRTTDDFGHLGEAPGHPELLDYLADRLVREGWSTKRMIRLLVTSATWRQQSVPAKEAFERDPENRLWHHLPMRRLEAEAIRDSLLAVSGRLKPTLFGPPIEPYRTAEDAQKRLFKGPLDGDGRRSVYLEMTLMETPRFLALFNQPIPKQTIGKRDVTNVPDQALALLNDPFVVEMAKQWSARLQSDGATSAEDRAARMLETAFARSAKPDEVEALVQLVRGSAQARGSTMDLLSDTAAWQDAAHAVFNLKEFIYVP
jgi:Protein of unknown function (DUF1553)/Protein of unknown function (DUF1549)/Planctomycete cytochrome C